MSSLRCGIVGLPNVGKSTLFNALVKKRVALSANYPFTTVEPNVGVVGVPDDRLKELAELVAVEEGMIPEVPEGSDPSNMPPIVPAAVQFVDIAGLVKGAHQGAGLGNQFLSYIRETDAIVHVLRDFSDPNIIREGSVNPEEDKLTVETELGLADLEILAKLIAVQETLLRRVSGGQGGVDPIESNKLEILNHIKKNLDEGKISGRFNIGDERVKKWFKTLPLISIKPVLCVYNVSEEDYGQKLHGREYNGNELVLSAKLEEELADLSEEERREYLRQIGIQETGLERLIKKAYTLLGLISFLTTTGKKEVRAWTVERETKALQAAGLIHTDFEKNFIRALVIPFEKLIESGSFASARQKGWIRTEGRDYLVKDGDVVEFLVGVK